MIIRDATEKDAERLLVIYAYYILNTAITFEYDVPDIEAFRNRIAHTLENYPYLVLEEDGKIQGYAYAGPFVGREAYRYSCELSIYLDKAACHKGYGRMLYAELERRLAQRGFLNLYACIASPIVEDPYLTRNSQLFHGHLGFVQVGEFHRCGYKFDRWYNMIWMEKIIGERNSGPISEKL